uniref:Uncharacterized protein n=1 Tax=Arundo donax TaxID=35708 RepID=A0A0A8Y203_ARUDO
MLSMAGWIYRGKEQVPVLDVEVRWRRMDEASCRRSWVVRPPSAPGRPPS